MFTLHRYCGAVPIYRLLFAASHRSITAFQVKNVFNFHASPTMQSHRNLCAVGCSVATQRNCGVVRTDLKIMAGKNVLFLRNKIKFPSNIVKFPSISLRILYFIGKNSLQMSKFPWNQVPEFPTFSRHA